MRKMILMGIVGIGLLFSISSCKKDSTLTESSVYVPTSADVTANATLTELQSGYSIYTSKCGSCHGLYSPDAFNATSWISILSSMAPKAGLSSADKALVYKYVTRGK